MATAGVLRFAALDRVPGINADEAYIPVQAQRLLGLASNQFTGFKDHFGRLKPGVFKSALREMDQSTDLRLLTPTGKPIDVLTLSYYLVALSILPPTFWVLRSYALFGGVLTVILGYRLSSRSLDQRTGVIVAFGLAVAPYCLACSRLAWEQCQVPLFGVLAFYLALTGKWRVLLLVYPLGLSIHPTNIFLVPVLTVLIVLKRMEQSGAGWETLRRLLLPMGVAIAGAGLIGGLILWKVRYIVGASLPTEIWFSPAEYARFIIWVGGIATGRAIYETITSTSDPGLAAIRDLVFWSMALGLILAGLPGLIRQRRWDRIALVTGAVTLPWLLYLTGGKFAMLPGNERYAGYLIVPFVLAFACLVDSVLGAAPAKLHEPRHHRLITVLSLAGWFCAWDFHQNYFQRIPAASPEWSYARVYATAKVEPKYQVYQIICNDVAARRRAAALPEECDLAGTTVVADDFWLYWPLAYLSARSRPARVILRSKVRESRAGDCLAETIQSGAYFVCWANASDDEGLKAALKTCPLRQWWIRDIANRPLIMIYRRTDPTENGSAYEPNRSDGFNLGRSVQLGDSSEKGWDDVSRLGVFSSSGRIAAASLRSS